MILYLRRAQSSYTYTILRSANKPPFNQTTPWNHPLSHSIARWVSRLSAANTHTQISRPKSCSSLLHTITYNAHNVHRKMTLVPDFTIKHCARDLISFRRSLFHRPHPSLKLAFRSHTIKTGSECICSGEFGLKFVHSRGLGSRDWGALCAIEWGIAHESMELFGFNQCSCKTKRA